MASEYEEIQWLGKRREQNMGYRNKGTWGGGTGEEGGLKILGVFGVEPTMKFLKASKRTRVQAFCSDLHSQIRTAAWVHKRNTSSEFRQKLVVLSYLTE